MLDVSFYECDSATSKPRVPAIKAASRKVTGFIYLTL